MTLSRKAELFNPSIYLHRNLGETIAANKLHPFSGGLRPFRTADWKPGGYQIIHEIEKVGIENSGNERTWVKQAKAIKNATECSYRLAWLPFY